MESDKTISHPAESSNPTKPVKRPRGLKREGAKSMFSTLSILILAPLVALFLTAFVFQSYEVDGSSMETTLQNRDRLIVSKVPRTFAKVSGGQYIPERGEIIIFTTTALNDGRSNSQARQLVKRVIGVPGDRVVIKDGVVTVINNEFPEGFNPDKLGDYGEEVQHTSSNTDVLVNSGEVFVLGDNRDNSSDSRTIGTVPVEDIIGELVFRIYPLGNAKVF